MLELSEENRACADRCLISFREQVIAFFSKANKPVPEEVLHKTETYDLQWLISRYAELLMCQIVKRPRIVLVSKILEEKLQASPEWKTFFAIIKQKCIDGEDLNPHTSKSGFRWKVKINPGNKGYLYQRDQQTLYGVRHLHLSETILNGKAERSDFLLYVFFKGNFAYFLDVLPHCDGVWHDKHFVEIMESNWPNVRIRFPGKAYLCLEDGTRVEPTPEDLEMCIRNGITTAISVGDNLYPFWDGCSADTSSQNAVRKANAVHNTLMKQFFLSQEKGYQISSCRLSPDLTKMFLFDRKGRLLAYDDIPISLA